MVSVQIEAREIVPMLDAVTASYFTGFLNKDVAFLHTASKTLIEADLLFNLPATEQFSKSSITTLAPLLYFGGTSWLHKRAMWRLGINKECVCSRSPTICAHKLTELGFRAIYKCYAGSP